MEGKINYNNQKMDHKSTVATVTLFTVGVPVDQSYTIGKKILLILFWIE